MKAQTQPRLMVLVGPNGAGKSTLYQMLLRQKPVLHSVAFVNADDFTQALGGSHVAGGRAAIQRRKVLLDKHESLTWETTGSGKNEMAFIQQAKQSGYHIDVRFVGIASVADAVQRVKARVLLGGHDVPVKDIVRRYDRVMRKFHQLRAVADTFRVYDNTLRGHRLCYLEHERTLVREAGMPRWLKQQLDQIE